MSVIPLSRHAVPEAPSVRDTVEALARRLQATAIDRDRVGGHAAEEREAIRDSGLLTYTIPTEHGGQGGDWVTLFGAVRRLAEVDSALAHLLGFHHLQLAGVRLYGSPEQQARWLRDTVVNRWFWGNALNPLDKRLVARDTPGGYVLDGTKSFSSGSVGSDQLTFSAWHEATQTLVIAAVPTRRDGITVQADWDAFGQKQTDSGTVVFERVALAKDEVLQAPLAVPTPRNTVRTQVAQLVLVNLYLGIGLGAFQEAIEYNRTHAKPWLTSGVGRSVDDPYIQHRYGELALLLRPAQALAERAALLLDRMFALGEVITADDRGELAIAVAEAKVLAHRAGIEVSSQLFELTGARSTSARFGFDRFWRNARVHTLHDPIDYKLRDIGRHALTGEWPVPTAYS